MRYKYIVTHVQFIVRGSRDTMTSFRIGNNSKIPMVELFKTINNGVENIDFYSSGTELTLNIITDLGSYQKVITGKKLKAIFERLTK